MPLRAQLGASYASTAGIGVALFSLAISSSRLSRPASTLALFAWHQKSKNRKPGAGMAQPIAIASHRAPVEAEMAESSSSSSWHDVRGRTSRRRSSATETYVCVLAWIVRPPGVRGNIATGTTSDDNALAKSGHAGSDVMKAANMLGKVQDVRRRFDAAYSRWEPHVTLIPPFVVPFRRASDYKRSGSGNSEAEGEQRQDDDEGESRSADDDKLTELRTSRASNEGDPFEDLDIISERIGALCKQRATASSSQDAAIEIAFDRIDHFSLRRYKSVHLRPSPDSAGTSAFAELQSELAKILPEAFKNSRNAAARKEASASANTQGGQGKGVAVPQQNFTPHLTLGQASNKDKEAELGGALVSVGFVAEQPASMQIDRRTLPDSPSVLVTPLKVPVEAIHLLYKPIKRSGPYDVYREFQLSS